MSYLGNTSDLESEKLEFGRNRATNLVSKLQASKISSEPKWSKKRNDDSDSESTNENFLTKGFYEKCKTTRLSDVVSRWRVVSSGAVEEHISIVFEPNSENIGLLQQIQKNQLISSLFNK